MGAFLSSGARRGCGAMPGLRRFLLGGILLTTGLGGCTVREIPRESDVPEAGSPEETAAEITGMLQSSSASWNAGDLDGFLDDYWQSEELTFSGPSGVTRGWEDVRERYLQSYWAPGADRDSLRFEDLEVTALGDDHALVLGRYVLFRPHQGDSVTGTGHFSLVLRRMENGWKILHDHTSATPPGEGEG